ncbi:MAG: type II 3-dehydroquinate dehydratase [Deltaproteobacteria bacterium]|nr:type II 3-dehydroquinate dehydratase [Deltaproteobacteria bacterium]
MKTSLLVIHGPNLNLLGSREPEIYGTTTLPLINEQINKRASQLGLDVHCVQTNHEGKIIDLLQEAEQDCKAVILNPAAYTHTSIAIRDAIAAISIPVIEIHLSQISKREPFRHTSLTAPVCAGLISCFGYHGYLLAVEAAALLIK